MSTGTKTARFRCAQCERPEDECECEKYCCLCQAVVDVRICGDGHNYSQPFRDDSDYNTNKKIVPQRKNIKTTH